MQNVTLIDIDPGKHSFRIHCQNKSGKALRRKKFIRTRFIEFLAGCTSATVVMEACAGAHFMARRIADSDQEAKLISPQFIRLLLRATRMILSMLKPYANRHPVPLCDLCNHKPKLSRPCGRFTGSEIK